MRAKLPLELQDFGNRDIFNALMFSEGLTDRCQEGPVRLAAMEAVKCFWVRVMRERELLREM